MGVKAVWNAVGPANTGRGSIPLPSANLFNY